MPEVNANYSLFFSGYDTLLDSTRNNLTLEKAKRRGQYFERILQEKVESGKGMDKRLLDACYDMEAIFVSNMLKTMRKTIHETDFFGKSIAKDIFSDMLYNEYAKIMAETDQFGLAQEIYNQLRVQKSI